MRSGTQMDKSVSVRAGRCSVCGRRLTDPESVKRGIGPVCYRKVEDGFAPRKQRESNLEQFAGVVR